MRRYLFVFILLSAQSLFSAPLDGLWKKTCSHRSTREELFAGDHVKYSEKYFADDLCGVMLVAFISSGPFQVLALETQGLIIQGRISGAQKINFIFEHAEIVLQSPQIVVDFNQRKVCGREDWTTGTHSIINLTCDFFKLGRDFPAPKYGQEKFGIFKVATPLLYFGQLSHTFDGSTDSKRPQELEPEPYHRMN